MPKTGFIVLEHANALDIPTLVSCGLDSQAFAELNALRVLKVFESNGQEFEMTPQYPGPCINNRGDIAVSVSQAVDDGIWIIPHNAKAKQIAGSHLPLPGVEGV